MQLSTLPDHSRVWVFQADRILTEEEVNLIQQELAYFIPQWAAHGQDLYGAYEVRENLFIVIAVDEQKAPASGCSIDALTRVIKDLGVRLKVDFFNRLCLSFEREPGQIELMSMEAFKSEIATGQINMDTIVFNNLVRNKEELDENWRTEARNSWHTNLFSLV